MRLADITIGNTYIVGRQQLVNTGLYGVPVVVLAKGKFTTISQPCGQVIIPFDGDKRTELVVAVRACDASHLRPRNSWSDRLPRYRAPNNPYTEAEIAESGYDNGKTPFRLKTEGQHWIPMVIAPTKIVMSEEEFRTKEGPAREVYDASRAAYERRQEAQRKYEAAIADLKNKVLPPVSIGPFPNSANAMHSRAEMVYVPLDEFIKLVEKADVRGTKTRIRVLAPLKADFQDAVKQEAAARSCVQKAGL